MKWKYSIIAVGITALFIGLAFTPATAIESSEKEKITIDYQYYAEDGKIISGHLDVAEDVLDQFIDEMFNIFEKINKRSDLDNIDNLIAESQFFENNPKLAEVIINILGILPVHRALVMSRGKCFSFNPFKRSNLDFRDRLSAWRYSGLPIIDAKTYMLRPYRSDFKILKGAQMGLMTRFVGMQIFIAKTFPSMCKTFFIGTPRYVFGADVGL